MRHCGWLAFCISTHNLIARYAYVEMIRPLVESVLRMVALPRFRQFCCNHMKKNRSPDGSDVTPVRKARKTASGSQLADSFPIIGIGASAGGFEALEQFIANVPENCGMGFVIVQHLDPTRKGLMPELLQRSTPMKVVQVKDRMRVHPGCVYVIPPNKNMSILHGVLHLFEPSAKRGQRLPIDFFFRSLAQDQQQRAIGVILSGMGSDGQRGCVKSGIKVDGRRLRSRRPRSLTACHAV